MGIADSCRGFYRVERYRTGTFFRILGGLFSRGSLADTWLVPVPECNAEAQVDHQDGDWRKAYSTGTEIPGFHGGQFQYPGIFSR